MADTSTAHPSDDKTSAARVFISHSEHDRALVEWIAGQVRAAGHVAWVAEWELEPGGRISQKVESALRESDAYILLLSEGGYASTYVQHEVGAAVISGKPVIALVDRSLANRPLGMLADIEQVRFDRDDVDASAAAVLAGLRRIGEARGLKPAASVAAMPPTPSLVRLKTEISSELQFSGEDIAIGIAAVALILGVLYLTKGSGPA